MPQRQTAPVPSHIPVGQPPYIFDVGTHKFDGTLYPSRAHTHTSSLSSTLWISHTDDTSTLFSLIAPSIYDISRPLFHTHCICYIFCLRYHRHIFPIYLSCTPKKHSRTHTPSLSRFVSISHTPT